MLNCVYLCLHCLTKSFICARSPVEHHDNVMGSALDSLRLLLRQDDSATKLVFTRSAVSALVNCAEILPPLGCSSAHSYPALPALKCLVNIFFHGQEALLLESSTAEAVIAVLRGPGRCQAHAVAAFLAFQLAGSSSKGFSLLISAAGGTVSSLLNLVVPLLGWSVRSEISAGISEGSKPRRDLSSSLLKLLPLIRSRESAFGSATSEGGSLCLASAASMEKLAALFAEILVCPHSSDISAYALPDLRPLVVRSMAFAADPTEGGGNEVRLLADCLEEYGALKALVNLLQEALGLKCASSPSNLKADVVPLLMVITKLSSSSTTARAVLKSAVFPPETDVACASRITEVASILPGGQNAAGGVQKQHDYLMHPADAPPGTLRAAVIALIRSYDSNLKRCSSEMLLELCAQDMAEFTSRVGYGNAVYMMHVRGGIKLAEMSN